MASCRKFNYKGMSNKLRSVRFYFLKEHHLQKVLSAHLHCDEEDGIVIPIPDMNMIEERFNRFYTRGVYKPPKQYIHVQRRFTEYIYNYSLKCDLAFSCVLQIGC